MTKHHTRNRKQKTEEKDEETEEKCERDVHRDRIGRECDGAASKDRQTGLLLLSDLSCRVG